jgi:ribonuclease P protein component
MADHSFGREYRIRSKKEIERVFARRCSVADDCIIIYGCENGLNIPRLAIVASRKLGKTVFRNRWKRLIREVFRQNKRRIPHGIDYVVIPKRGAKPDFHVLYQGFPRLGRQLKRRLERSAGQRQGQKPPVLLDVARSEGPSGDAIARQKGEASRDQDSPHGHAIMYDNAGGDQGVNKIGQQAVSESLEIRYRLVSLAWKPDFSGICTDRLCGWFGPDPPRCHLPVDDQPPIGEVLSF